MAMHERGVTGRGIPRDDKVVCSKNRKKRNIGKLNLDLEFRRWIEGP